MLVTTTLFLFFNALKAATERSHDDRDDQPDDYYRYNYCYMDKVLMVLVTIKLSQECLKFLPKVLDAALFNITVVYLLLW